MRSQVHLYYRTAFLTKPVRETLEDVAEQLKNSCMEEVQAYTRN